MENTRKQLIDLLEKRNNQYTSGQLLSEKLHISRAAVWKHMKELKKDGYEIEAVSGKGYRIQSQPMKLSANTLKWGLHTDWLGKQLVHKEQVASTQRIAHQLAMEGAENGLVVIADEQTKGRGRMERNWYSAKDRGIWMSIVLRPEILPSRAPQITLLAAAALAELTEKETGLMPQIKWPNDLLINGKKVAGILTEMQAEQDRIQYIVLGIGINVNHDKTNMPDDIREIATSFRMETGLEWNVHPLVQGFLTTFEQEYESFLANGFAAVKQKWERYGYRIGERVSIQSGNTTFKAQLSGIEPDGALRIIKDNGKEEVLYSAEIQW